MGPRDNFSIKGPAAKDIEIATELQTLANPLSVVHGYTQLLLRRLRRGQVIEREDLLRTLGCIEEASLSVQTCVQAMAGSERAGE